MTATYVEKWRACADDFVTVLLVNTTAWQRAVELSVSSADLPGGAWPEVYNAVIDLRGERLRKPGSPVLGDTEVAARCGQTVTVEWVSARIAAWDESRELAFETTCNLLCHYGRGHRQLEALRQGQARVAAALEQAQDTDEPAQRVVEDLRNEYAQEETPVDIADLVLIEEERMSQPPDEGIRTGIWLLDDWLRGLSPGEFVGWVAPYKSRKTSIMAAVLLNMAREGKSCTVFSYDESRERFTNRLQALVMAEYMWNNGHWDLRAPDGTALNVVDGKMIRNAGDRWRRWPLPLQHAREYARDELAALRGRIRVYDAKTKATTLQSIGAVCLHDGMKYHGLDVIMVDHIQRLGGFDRTYDAVEFGSSGLHNIGGEMGAVMWVLSQQNEEAIKSNDSSDWTPNTKGGGGLAANADTVIVSKYKYGAIKDPHYLRVELRLAREADAPAYGYVEIHPASGWVTPRRVDVKTLNLADPSDNAPGGAR